MWMFFFLFFILLAADGAVYLLFRIRRFSFVRRIAEKSRALSWLVSAALLSLVGLFALINVWTVVIVLLHLMVAWALCDFVAFIVRKTSKRDFGHDAQGAAAIVLCAVYLGIGWYNAHNVSITSYEFTTKKDVGEGIRIVEIADCHIGITLDGESFGREMERVNGLGPDAVVVVGDFIDDDTELYDMVEACRALGELKAKYGVYYVYGNHDKGYYRIWVPGVIRDELESNGVVILEDESVLVDGRFYIVGRKDRSSGDREEIGSLISPLDGDKYKVILDHQPNDYDAEAAAGADLVLSGHTHGGHMFPAGYIGLAMGSNDRVYGTEKRGDTTFVVTSGISGWAIPFKTGTSSEIVVIDVKN